MFVIAVSNSVIQNLNIYREFRFYVFMESEFQDMMT